MSFMAVIFGLIPLSIAGSIGYSIASTPGTIKHIILKGVLIILAISVLAGFMIGVPEQECDRMGCDFIEGTGSYFSVSERVNVGTFLFLTSSLGYPIGVYFGRRKLRSMGWAEKDLRNLEVLKTKAKLAKLENSWQKEEQANEQVQAFLNQKEIEYKLKDYQV